MNLILKRTLGIVLAGLAVMTSQSVAAPLNLQFAPGSHADISSILTTITYDAGNDAFTAVGTSSQYDPVFIPQDLSDIILPLGGVFDLNTTIDDNGALFGGTFTITGDIGNGFGTLLSGNLTDFGFDDTFASDVFEFAFDVTGGDTDVVSAYGGLSAKGGMILGTTGFSSIANFTTGWSNKISPGLVGGAGTVDIKGAIVPEPAEYSLLLGAASILLLSIIRRRK